MKTVKIALGTVFGLATVCYLVLFLQALTKFILVWARDGYSPRGLSETGSAFAALCIGVAFTTWTFQSAFKKRMPQQEENHNGDEDDSR